MTSTFFGYLAANPIAMRLVLGFSVILLYNIVDRPPSQGCSGRIGKDPGKEAPDEQSPSNLGRGGAGR
jgi:hypothetical protein